MIALDELKFRKDGPTQSATHSDGVVGAIMPFKLPKPMCSGCGRKHAKGVPCFGMRKAWDESKHPRGEPENAGEFGPGGGAAQSAEVAPATTKPFTPLPRSQMPQLGGKPTPGTRSADLPVNVRGNVDLSDAFIDELKSRGVKVTDKTVDPKSLKPSQSEINPTTVDTLASLTPTDKIKPLWVSNDGHIIDGTHRWAADLQRGTTSVDVREIDMPIKQALDTAREFAADWGVKQESVAESSATPANTSRPKKPLADVALDQAGTKGGFSLNPNTGGAPAGGYMVAIQGNNVEVPDITDLKDPGQRASVKAALVKFVTDNADLWKSNEAAYVGGWWDEANHEFTLDPSENIQDLGKATTLGQQRNQQEIWDVVNGTGIDTGGTGDRGDAGILKAAGGWLAGRTRSVGGRFPRPTDGGPGGHTGRPGTGDATIADQGPTDHGRSEFGFRRIAGDLGTVAGDGPQFRLIKAFNPDEARDETGKWTSGEDVVASRPLSRNARIKRDNAKDSRPSKAMRNLVQRDGVKTVADLKPGDVFKESHFDRTEYGTVEALTDSTGGENGEIPYKVVVYRRPSGRMGELHAQSSTSVTDDKQAFFNYVGTEPKPDRKTEVYHPNGARYEIERPAFRDTINITRPLLDSHLEDDTARAVAIVESRAPKGSLDGVRVTMGTTSPGAYAQYDKGDREVMFSSKWADGTAIDKQAVALTELGRSYKQTVDSNFHPQRNGYSATTAIIVHELGHHLEMNWKPIQIPGSTTWALNTPLSQLSQIDPQFRYFDDGAVAPGGLVNVTFNDTVADTVSSYATTNIREFMAEAYTEGMLADRPRPMAKLVAKLLNHETVTVGDTDAARAQWEKAKAKAEEKPRSVNFKMVDKDGNAIGRRD